MHVIYLYESRRFDSLQFWSIQVFVNTMPRKEGISSNLRVIILATVFFLISMGKVIRSLPNNLKTIFKRIHKRKMFKTMSQSCYDWTFQ